MRRPFTRRPLAVLAAFVAGLLLLTAPDAAALSANHRWVWPGCPGWNRCVDDFTSPTLDPAWTVTGRNDKNISLSSTPGALTITAAPASLYESDNRIVNLFTRPLPAGDLDVTTRLDFPARDDIQSAGLLLYADPDNYVYLSKVHQGGQAFLAGIESDGHYSSELLENTIGDTAELRIYRIGTTLRFAVRGDRGWWQPVGQSLVSTTVYPSVGLFASTSGAAGVPASFDWVRLGPPSYFFDIGALPLPLPGNSATPTPRRGQTELTYTNPVQSWTSGDPSIADPGVLKAPDGFYYLVSTESEYSFSPYHALPIFRSPDLVHWTYLNDVFSPGTGFPSWANTEIADRKDFWAPDLSFYRGKYYLYYAATQKSDPAAPTDNKAIGVATADSPAGPWHDSGKPVVTGTDFRAIDAQAFTDTNGARYLYWGSEFYPILGQRLSADGTSVVGPRHQVLPSHQGSSYFFDTRATPFKPNLENLIEGTWMVKRGFWYYLFYSGPNCCGPGANYAVAVARSTSPFGPFTKNPGNPILKGNDTFFAPGHNAIVSDDAGQDWMVYHAMDKAANPTGDASRRILLIDKVEWQNGWPRVDGPSVGKQTAGPIIDTRRVPTDLPPSAVGSPTVSASTPDSATLTWTSATDDRAVAGYRVYLNGVQRAGLPASARSATVAWLTACTTYALTVRAVDSAGQLGSAGGQILTTIAGCPAGAATNRQVDTTTQGNWIGRYGSTGYNIAGDASKTAPAVAVTPPANPYTWDPAPTDVRATQRADGSGRIAAAWFGGSVDVGIGTSGTQSHRVGVYLLDWDGQGARRETLTVTDRSGQVLDRLDAADLGRFDNGTVVSWLVTGDVTITATVAGGANAVINAVFVDPAGG